MREAAGIRGVLFAVWAPNAERVSVVGDFNQWDGRAHAMRNRGGCGVWEIFLPELAPGVLYKFEIRAKSGLVFLKSDPYGQYFERRPRTASRVVGDSSFEWHDGDWLEQRKTRRWLNQPMSVYEVHLGSWQRDPQGETLAYRDIAHPLNTETRRRLGLGRRHGHGLLPLGQ